VLDMATSVVPRGKLEVYNRLEKPLPSGWATDEEGIATDDPGRVLRNFMARAGGGLLPLGGEGELFGGHKGYGLALMIELLSGVLSGAAYMDLVYPKDESGRPLPANIGHVFGAIRVDAFRPLAEFKANMDDAIRRLRDSSKARGQERVWVHGEKEFNLAAQNRADGIPLHDKVVNDLQAIAQEIDIPFDLGL
jgi:L-2-hydroxycarboxylate dehydrogenase (NAD+)